MDLAVRTTASPAAIWAIVIVAVICLAFWLVMVMVYANRPDARHRRLAVLTGPVLGGIHMSTGGRSVSPNRVAPAVFGDDFLTDLAAEQVPAQRGPAAPAEPAPAAGATTTSGEAPTEPIPAQRTASSGSAPADTAGSGAGGGRT